MAGPCEPWLGVSLRATGAPPRPEALIGSVAVKLASASTSPGLTNREVWGLAFRALPLGARQGGADQPTVNRTVILDAIGNCVGHVFGIPNLGGR